MMGFSTNIKSLNSADKIIVDDLVIKRTVFHITTLHDQPGVRFGRSGVMVMRFSENLVLVAFSSASSRWMG